jgi:hypothetical protein
MVPLVESTLRNNCLPECHKETLNTFFVLFGKENIWVTLDEISDANGRVLANVVIGVLRNDQVLQKESFLLLSRKYLQ